MLFWGRNRLSAAGAILRPGAGKCRLLLPLLLLSGWPAAAQVPPTPAAMSARRAAEAPPAAAVLPAEPEYRIGPEDVLDLYVMDVPELSREYTVSSTGAITLPLLSAPLPAAGLTLNQFSGLVGKRLQAEGFVSDPRVSSSVRESRTHAVAITGAVKQPQMYRVLGRTTLLDVLAQAGGLAEDAGSLAIVRRGEVGLQTLRMRSAGGEPPPSLSVDLEPLLGSGGAAANLDIYPGDRITVPRAGIVYVVGAVNRPGGFPLRTGREGITVLQALALAEDLKTSAVRDRAVILHGDAAAPGGYRQMPVNLKRLLAGKAADPVLRAQDILFIPDSSSRRALRRSAEAVLQVVTGMAIYRF